MTAQFLLLTAALASTAAAQEPTPAPKPMVTVEGCVATENEIPGRKENLAERAGLSEDFILTGAKVLKGQAPPAAAADTSGGVVSNALRPMYEIGGLTDEQLKIHVGRRVRIEGTFGNEHRDAAAPKNDDLVELNATTIRQVPGTCAVPKS